MTAIDIPKKVREFAAMAEALAALVELADKVNAWQQQEAEHKARLAQLATDEAEIRERIAAGDRSVAEAQKRALAITDQAKLDGEAVRAKAAAEADQIRDAAAQAVEVAKAKERRAEADQRKAEQATAAAQALLAEIQSKLAEAQATIARAEAISAAMKG